MSSIRIFGFVTISLLVAACQDTNVSKATTASTTAATGSSTTTPSTPGTTTTPTGTPGHPGVITPGNPGSPGIPGTPGHPGVITPGNPGGPIVIPPGNPGQPTRPIQPGNPITPVIPRQPVIPLPPLGPTTPLVPSQPYIPQAPVLPVQPVTPYQPVLPTGPYNPGVPYNPGTPYNPGYPSNPGTPYVPSSPTPTSPNLPSGPTYPSDPHPVGSDPGTPVTPVQPSTPITTNPIGTNPVVNPPATGPNLPPTEVGTGPISSGPLPGLPGDQSYQPLAVALADRGQVAYPAFDALAETSDVALKNPQSAPEIAAAQGNPPVDIPANVPVLVPRKIKEAHAPRDDRYEAIYSPRSVQCPVVPVAKTPVATKLDILFIVDTSGSLDSERGRVAHQMDSFVRRLDPSTDFEIGVLLAHQPARGTSLNGKPMRDGNWAGELYAFDTKQDQPVLSFNGFYTQELALKNGDKKAAKTAALSRIIALLEKKMLTPKDKNVGFTDHTPAEGELGLFTAFNAVTNQSQIEKMRSQGFLRKDAALAVFFISDENDVCYDYQALCKPGDKNCKPAYKEKNGKKPAAPIGRDPVEQTTFDSEYCSSSVNGKRLEPFDVYSALEAFKKQDGMPLIVSGAIYTPASKIPRCFPGSHKPECAGHTTDPYADEKEIGRGYTDLIELNSTIPVDLASSDFGSKLAELGQQTKSRLRIDNRLDCNLADAGVSIDEVDPNTVQVSVVGEDGQTLVNFDSSCTSANGCTTNGQTTYPIDPVKSTLDDRRQPHLHVTVDADQLASKLGKKAGQVKISFKTAEAKSSKGKSVELVKIPKKKASKKKPATS